MIDAVRFWPFALLLIGAGCTSRALEASENGLRDAANPDAAMLDAAIPDAAIPDAAMHDAAIRDAEPPDVPVRDAAIPDAAIADAARPDAPPGPSEATSWGIHPAHDNAQPNDVVASPLYPRWTARFNGTPTTPMVTGGRVIVAASEPPPDVQAFDLETGSLLWGPVVLPAAARLTYENGRVFALDQNGQLTALDVTSGVRPWSVQLQGQMFWDSPPVAAGGLVFANGLGQGGLTVAVDQATGVTRWTHGWASGGNGAVAVAGGVVYQNEVCNQVTALDASSGSMIWSIFNNCYGGGGFSPAVYQGRIWSRDFNTNIIYSTSGAMVGTFTAWAEPALHGGRAFYVDSGRTLTVVDIQTNATLWSFRGDSLISTAAAVAGGGQVFVGSESGNVYELDELTGAQRSVFNVGMPVTFASENLSMAIAGGHLLVPAGSTLVVF